MTQTITLYDIYQADLFSRAKATLLVDNINLKADTVILDFEGITFMTRSFTDELYNIVIDFLRKEFHYIHRVKEKSLIDIITKVYRQQRNHFDSGNRRESIPSRIVSVSKPYVRPIVRV